MMTPHLDPKIVNELAAASSLLSVHSDELNNEVILFDALLKKFNIGIEVWIACETDTQPGLQYFLGHAKIDNKWGLALAERSNPATEREVPPPSIKWRFSDAPRALRVCAVDEIPRLVAGASDQRAR